MNDVSRWNSGVLQVYWLQFGRYFARGPIVSSECCNYAIGFNVNRKGRRIFVFRYVYVYMYMKERDLEGKRGLTNAWLHLFLSYLRLLHVTGKGWLCTGVGHGWWISNLSNGTKSEDLPTLASGTFFFPSLFSSFWFLILLLCDEWWLSLRILCML